MNPIAITLNDLHRGIKNHRIWLRLAKNDIRDRYQRSRIGPIWITLSMLIMVVTFGVLYGKLLGRDLSIHVPYVATGLAIWVFYSDVIIKSCNAFSSNSRIIQQLPLPLSVFLYQLLAREMIVLAHHFILVAVIFLLLLHPVSLKILLFIPAFILLSINALSLGFIFATISTRYRDVTEIVTALIRPMMFITPIIWSIDMVPERAFYLVYNPIYYLIDIVRSPILGQSIKIESWIFVTFFTACVMLIAIIVYGRFRNRIIYWL